MILISKCGKEIQIDSKNYEFYKNKTLCIRDGYVIRYIYNKEIKHSKPILISREITNCPRNKVVDHIDGNKLNNQKSNLRVCTQYENQLNRVKNHFKKDDIKYKGVQKRVKGNAIWYRARINYDYKQKHLGNFKTPEEAAKAYNEAAIKYHGEFAKLNKV